MLPTPTLSAGPAALRAALLVVTLLLLGSGAQATGLHHWPWLPWHPKPPPPMPEGDVWWHLDGVNEGNLCQSVGGWKACSWRGYDTASRHHLDALPGGYGAARGNTLRFVEEGEEVLAAAFSTTGTGGTFETAFLGNYPGGLGVLNERSHDSHTVSNANGIDLVVFDFGDDGFRPTAVRLSNFGDSDVTILVGGTGAAFGVGDDPFAGFAGLTFADLEALGFARTDDLDDDDGRNRNVDIDLGTGRYLVVAAYEGHHYERFKIKKVHGARSVAEPGAFVLLAAGMGGLLLAGRRR